MVQPNGIKTCAVLQVCCSAGLAILLLACSAARPTKIKQILDHPREYDGREVTIEGQVQTSANLVLFKYFVLKDDTAEIIVITSEPVPTRVERLRVRGRVNQAFAFQGKSLTVVMEDSKD